jgi:uncharacterized damage-inducible protein DinB
MSDQEPAISFRDLLAYTDYLAGRWLNYFQKNPAALDVDIGGRTATLRALATHIFQVEDFFANFLLQEDAVGMGRPAPMEASQIEDLERMHREAHDKFTRYLASVNEETLEKPRTLGPVTASNRKVLAQAVLHSVHHWAQGAM